MTRKGIGAALVALAVGFVPVGVAADWKTKAVSKTVGKAAREGLEDAARNAALDATLDAALPDNVADVAKKAMDFDVDDAKDAINDAGKDEKRKVKKIDSRDVIGAVAGEGVEDALRVADMAKTLDDVADATKTLNKMNKVRKAIK
jgi:hypothetical protein